MLTHNVFTLTNLVAGHVDPTMFYLDEFGHSRPKRRGVGMGPKIGDAGALPLKMRSVAPHRENMPLPEMVYYAKFGSSRSNGTSFLTEIRRRKWTLRVPPFKVTRCHWNRHGSIGYL